MRYLRKALNTTRINCILNDDIRNAAEALSVLNKYRKTKNKVVWASCGDGFNNSSRHSLQPTRKWKLVAVVDDQQ